MNPTVLRHFSLFVLPFAAASTARAQQLPRDSVYQRLLDFPSLVRGGRVTPRWMADGHSFWYQDGATRAVRLVDGRTGRIRPLFDSARARAALGPELGAAARPGQSITVIELADRERSAVVEVAGRRFGLELATHRVYPIEAAPSRQPDPSEARSPDGTRLAFIRDWNVWTRPVHGGADTAVTDDGVPGFGWTRDPYYTRPIPLLWSPDARSLLAVTADQRSLNRTTIVDWHDQRAERVVMTGYPLPGGAVEQGRVCVLGVDRRSKVCLDSGPDRDQVRYPVGWRPDGREAFAIRFDRFMKRLDLFAMDPETGSGRIVVTDSQPTFVEGVGFIRESLWYPLGRDGRFVWRSERDGWSHLYLYQYDGRLLGRITAGPYRVDLVVAADERLGVVYFLGRAEPGRPYDVHLYRAGLDGSGFRRLTEEPGEHDIAFSPDRTVFLDTHSDIDRPPLTQLRRSTDGRVLVTVARADISALVEAGWRAPLPFVVKAADGETDLHGALYLPTRFDATRRYPVIDNQYMGNIRQAVPHRFVGNYPGDESYALAERGFVVVVVDGRGTIGRSKAFHDATYRRVGTFEVADHVAALRQLAARHPFMDTTRVGITGFSWGGYYTLRALLTAPEVFKVGVSGAPIVDLDARANRIEPYMGTPESNPDGYARASNVALADRLQGKLMIAVGTSDSNVTFTHPMRMVKALVAAGKFFDLVVLPGENHNLSPAGQRYYVEARARFFERYLLP